MDEMFHAEPARPKKDLRYHGVGSGIIDIGSEAEEILGEINYGEAFAYLFRRFGFSAFGCDDFKDLVKYILTSPVEDTFLVVKPNTATDISFAYLVPDKIYGEILREDSTPVIEWRSCFRNWAKERHDITFRIDEFGSVAEEDEEKWNQYKSLFEHEHPFPERTPWEKLPETSRTYQTAKALRATITDLLAPVYIRDWYINICGRVPPEELESIKRKVGGIDPSSHAGFGIASEYINSLIEASQRAKTQ